MNKRLLSMFLALCMIVSMLPVTALAEELHTTIGTSGEIISFAPLTETSKAVSLGTSITDLELPETLTATVRTAVPAAENPTQDSGSPETATPTTAAEPEWEETTGDIPVTWDSPDYDMNTGGEYVFTPVIEGYTVSATLPEITVTVDEILAVAPTSVALRSFDTIDEQFTLAPGGIYYFDLSGEKSNIGTVNTALPDTSLHYVPFTYVGTVNAYSLTSAMATTEEYATANKSDRSLFVGDYVIGTSVSWNSLDTASLIFGKPFDTNYKLRSLSAGSSKTGSASDGSDNVGQPNTNEWDQILDKSGSTDNTTGWIKNWSGNFIWAQDSSSAHASDCALRGNYSARHWYDFSARLSSRSTVSAPPLKC